MHFKLLILLKNVYGKIIPRFIREKINMGKKLQIQENINKKLPEYDYGYLKPNKIKMKLFLNDFVQRNIYITGYHEKEESFSLLKLLPINGIFFDIGANIGAYSFIFCKKAKHIYSFEATKRTFDIFCDNIELNKINNITPVFAAVHSTDNLEINIYSEFPDNCGGNSMHIFLEGKTIANTVKSITIDKYVQDNNIRTISLIKMDIEGNELNAFKGMTKSLLTYRPIIFCEMSPAGSKAAGSDIIELFNYVTENCKYNAKILKENDFKEIDQEYIRKIANNINCYFFPK